MKNKTVNSGWVIQQGHIWITVGVISAGLSGFSFWYGPHLLNKSESPTPGNTAIFVNGGTSSSQGNLIVGEWDHGIYGKNASIISKNDTFIKGNGQSLPIAPPTGEFSKLSNAELKKSVLAFASKLRASENSHDSRESDVLLDNTKMQELINLADKKNSDFKNLFLSRAKSFESEIIFRLGEKITTPPNNMGGLLLIHGNLAGIKPMTQVADFLEYLAQELPE